MSLWHVEAKICGKNIKFFHSLLFDFVSSGACHLSSVCLRLAAMPQVDEGLADAQQHHRDPGAQAAAVTGHLQQVALHLHLPPHTVQTPVIWRGIETEGVVRDRDCHKLLLFTL